MSDFRPTDEQRNLIRHTAEAFVEACPGARKTGTVVARLKQLSSSLPPRKGVALVSFTNSAVEEFTSRCREIDLGHMLRHPGFVGTFDVFIRHFFIAAGGLEGVNVPPTMLDSWRTLGVEIRLADSNAYRGPGNVWLDHFDPRTNQIDPDSIGLSALRQHVRQHQSTYEAYAAQRRQAFHRSGYFTAADARVEVIRRLDDENWGDALGKAIAGRFHELIVDEAQDCNPLDLAILKWLRSHGVPVLTVSDLDQAIYGFRHSSPSNLRTFRSTFREENRLTLTGNFRSSPIICDLAATLRTRATPDQPLGRNAAVRIPVQLLLYSEPSPTAKIGEKFAAIIQNARLDIERALVLAHGRTTAARAAGYAASNEDVGTSNVAALARSTGSFWSASASGRTREATLRSVERQLLDLMGKIDAGETPARAAERRNIDARWLRRSALELLTRLPRTCEDSDEGCRAWVDAARQEIGRLGLTCGPDTSLRRYFQFRAPGRWRRYLEEGGPTAIQCSTIHEAKGHEFESVCLVLPPDRGERRLTRQLLDEWKDRVDSEPKRVVYVGVTRAEKLISLALPTVYRTHLTDILDTNSVAYEIHELS